MSVVRSGAVSLVAVFLVGGCVGRVSAPDATTEYEVLEYPQEVQVTKTVEVPTYPAACADLANLTLRVSKAGTDLDAATSGLLDLMSRTRVAVIAKDTNTLNNLDTELRALDRGTIAAVETLGLLPDDIAAASQACLNGDD